MRALAPRVQNALKLAVPFQFRNLSSFFRCFLLEVAEMELSLTERPRDAARSQPSSEKSRFRTFPILRSDSNDLGEST